MWRSKQSFQVETYAAIIYMKCLELAALLRSEEICVDVQNYTKVSKSRLMFRT